jgi:hypothetical protein
LNIVQLFIYHLLLFPNKRLDFSCGKSLHGYFKIHYTDPLKIKDMLVLEVQEIYKKQDSRRLTKVGIIKKIIK